MEIGMMLQNARKLHCMSQLELSKSIGISLNQVSYIERGLSKCSVNVLLGYCSALGISPNELLGIDTKGVSPELISRLVKLDDVEQKKILDVVNTLYGEDIEGK